MSEITDAKQLAALKEDILDSRKSTTTYVTVCGGTGCHAYGCMEVAEEFKKEIKASGLEDVEVRVTGCHGFCERGPITLIKPDGIFYQRIKTEDVKEVVEETLKNKKIIDRLLYEEPDTSRKIEKEESVPFYSLQKRIIFGNNGDIDPTDIKDYIAVGGYTALAKSLNGMGREAIIDEVLSSGLRGRGGAGFPTGRKWKVTAAQKSDKKYVVCNCDEGDPGAYMDRSLMEGNPHGVIEGMAIGAYAIGADEGYLYIRDEYPLAVQNTTKAIEDAKEAGLLGKNILGSGFNFDLHVFRGAGAFVSGEESALLVSIEGRIGVPVQRPPYPAEKGLWNKPTNINNVETWANVPHIVNNGAEWYAGIGTEGSKGTKIFSLVGKINNTGLVEVPMGMKLRDIIFKIGGGIPGSKEFKAVQTGGPSGGCLPKEKLDLPIDYDTLTEAGSMMGSGGMIVMDENNCMVDVARYFLNFLRDESCGKCISCREGTQRMYEIVSKICEGHGSPNDIPLLEELAEAVKDASMCALGQTAANPVLSTLRYFRDEYETHIKDKKCPAGVCKELITYSVIDENCTGCLACKRVCPSDAITGELKEVHVIHTEKCIKCGACFEACNFDAIEVK